MFGKHHTLKQLSGGIAIAASLAVIAVPSAVASTSSRSFITDTLGGNGSAKAVPDAFERYVAIHGAQQTQAQGTRFITDTLGGNGSPKATPDLFERSVAIHEWREARAQARAVLAQQAQGTTFITDTLGGNGHAKQVRGYNPGPYVYGGASPAVARAIQDVGNGLTAAPSVTGGSSGTSFSWGDAGIGAGLAAGLLLLLLAGTRLRTQKRGVLAA
jgi:hypothetical protein